MSRHIIKHNYVIVLHLMHVLRPVLAHGHPPSCGYIIQLKNNYLSVGSDLNLTCVLDATLVKKGLNSNHLYFAFRSEAVSDVFYSTPAPDRLTLYKRNVSAVDGGSSYSCLMNGSKVAQPIGCSMMDDYDGSFWIDRQMVKVGDPPSKVDELACVSPDHVNMTCSWSLQQAIPGIYNMTYSARHSMLVETGVSWTTGSCVCYEPDMNGKFGNCRVDWCRFDNTTCKESERFHANTTYLIEITGRNNFGTRLSTFNVTTDERIVKPGLVVNVSVVSFSSKYITVTWSRPSQLPPPLTLHYNITWSTADGDVQTLQTLRNDISIRSLQPFMNYTVRISSKPLYGGYISDPYTIKITTMEDAPDAAPVVPPGGFHWTSCRNIDSGDVPCYDLLLYWQGVPRDKANGEIRNYTIRIKTAGHKDQFYVSPGRGRSKAIRGLSSNSAHTVILSAYTTAGRSPETYLVVESMKGDYLPSDVSASITPDRSHVHITWRAPRDRNRLVTNYTLLWCEGSLDDGCKNDPFFHVYHGSSRNALIEITGWRSRPLVAISANYGQLSSGLTDWICIFENDREPASPAWVFSPQQYPRSLAVEWLPNKCVHDDLSRKSQVDRYVISWRECNETAGDVQPNCSGGYTIYSEVANQTGYIISGLDDLTPYVVTVRAISGNFESGGDTRLKWTLPSFPKESPSNVTFTNVTSSSLTVSWSSCRQPKCNVTKYRVYISQTGIHDNGSFVDIQGQYAASIKGLQSGSTYTLQVACCNVIWCSPRSAPISVTTTLRVPAPLPPVRVHVVSPVKAQVTWSAPLYQYRHMRHFILLANWTLREDGKKQSFLKNISTNSTSLANFQMTCSDNYAIPVSFRAIVVVENNIQRISSAPSNSTIGIMCSYRAENSKTMIVMTIVSLVLVIVVIAFIICWLVYKKTRKKITITTPPRLDNDAMEYMISKEEQGDITQQHTTAYHQIDDVPEPECARSMLSVHGSVDLEQQQQWLPDAMTSQTSDSDDDTYMSYSSCHNDCSPTQDCANGYTSLAYLKQKSNPKQPSNSSLEVQPLNNNTKLRVSGILERNIPYSRLCIKTGPFTTDGRNINKKVPTNVKSASHSEVTGDVADSIPCKFLHKIKSDCADADDQDEIMELYHLDDTAKNIEREIARRDDDYSGFAMELRLCLPKTDNTRNNHKVIGYVPHSELITDTAI